MSSRATAVNRIFVPTSRLRGRDLWYGKCLPNVTVQREVAVDGRQRDCRDCIARTPTRSGVPIDGNRGNFFRIDLSRRRPTSNSHWREAQSVWGNIPSSRALGPASGAGMARRAKHSKVRNAPAAGGRAPAAVHRVEATHDLEPRPRRRGRNPVVAHARQDPGGARARGGFGPWNPPRRRLVPMSRSPHQPKRACHRCGARPNVSPSGNLAAGCAQCDEDHVKQTVPNGVRPPESRRVSCLNAVRGRRRCAESGGPPVLEIWPRPRGMSVR